MNASLQSQILKKTAKILAQEKVEVHTEGFAPRVEYNSITKKPKAIFIPEVPAKASGDLIAAMQGLIDHECGHILESSAEDICDSTKGKLWHFIHNCIEDPRVNERMTKRYPGCEDNIRNAYEYIFKRVDPNSGLCAYDKSAIDSINFTDEEGVKDAQVNYSCVWFAKKQNCRFHAKKYDDLDLDRLYAPLEAKMDADKLALLANIKTTDDVRTASDYFTQFFKDNLKEPSSSSKSGEGAKKGQKAKPTEGRLDDPKKLEDTLADAIKTEIEDLAKKEAKNWHFSDRFDVHLDKHQLAKYNKSGQIHSFEDEVKGVSNYLSKDLRRFLESRNRRWYTGGFRSGRLNQNALHTVRSGNDRIFSKKSEIREVRAAVSLLIDLSGSMKGAKAEMACKAAYAFALSLEQLKVPYEIWGFTTIGGDHAKRAAFLEMNKTLDPTLASKVINTSCPDIFYAFKTFEEHFDVVSKNGLVAGGNSLLRMSSNEDSNHIKQALIRLSARPEEKKTLFVFSDGQPAFGGDCNTSHAMLKYLDRNSNSDYGVDMYGLGIMSDCVKKFYKQCKVINDLEELPTALFDILRTRI